MGARKKAKTMRNGRDEGFVDSDWLRGGRMEIPFDPENPSPEARAAFPQIGEDPGPEWITMQEVRRITGLRTVEILAINAVQRRRAVGRTRLIHFPSLRKVIAEALRSRFLSPSSTRV